MAENYTETRRESFSIGHFLVRWLVGAVVLAITAFFVRGFSIANIWSLLLASLVLAILDYAASRLLGIDAKPFGRGLTGFLLSAAIIYLTQYFVGGYSVTFWGAIIGAVVYGIVDMLIPGRAM